MKKTTNYFNAGDTMTVALLAVGFLTLVMMLSYIYWFA